MDKLINDDLFLIDPTIKIYLWYNSKYQTMPRSMLTYSDPSARNSLL